MARRNSEDKHPGQERREDTLLPSRAPAGYALAPCRGRDQRRHPQKAVISFGPEHAPLEQSQVALAIEESLSLVPKPKVIIFAAFDFDPEAAKDIDETNWPGITLLKAKMSEDLLTEDLKKKRASNDSLRHRIYGYSLNSGWAKKFSGSMVI